MNSVQERFWAKVDKNGPQTQHVDGCCWLWLGASDRNDYGRFNTGAPGEKSAPAYRVAFEWEHGPLAPGYQPDHLCKINLCVRPSHMEAVTSSENARRSSAKLTRDQVASIRRALKQGVTRTELKRTYSVNYNTIMYIDQGVTWPGVEPEELS